MRKKAKQRIGKLSQKLQGVRLSMANTMTSTYKNGDSSKCITGTTDESVRISYCTANFMDDFEQFSSCKGGDDFCTICCDNEFGDMMMSQRQQCYQAACANAKGDGNGAPAGGDGPSGRWVWQVPT